MGYNGEVLKQAPQGLSSPRLGCLHRRMCSFTARNYMNHLNRPFLRSALRPQAQSSGYEFLKIYKITELAALQSTHHILNGPSNQLAGGLQLGGPRPALNSEDFEL